jgi:hypothetical protein
MAAKICMCACCGFAGMRYLRAVAAARAWQLLVPDELCLRGDDRVLVAGLVRVRHPRGPIGAFLFQVASRREAMALFSPTMAGYPGSNSLDPYSHGTQTTIQVPGLAPHPATARAQEHAKSRSRCIPAESSDRAIQQE